MINVSFTIEGERQLSRRFHNLKREFDNWTPAFKQAVTTLKDLFSNEVFSSKGGAIGENWPPLDPEYSRWKSMHYPGKGMLERTGEMKRSFQTLYKTDYGAVWNTASYFAYHQSNKPRNKIPRRVMMKLGNEQREVVMKIFHRYFNDKLKKK
jgi:phage gpG-like protein